MESGKTLQNEKDKIFSNLKEQRRQIHSDRTDILTYIQYMALIIHEGQGNTFKN